MDVKVGQVWKSNDPRDGDRRLKVVEVGGTHAVVANTSTSKLTKIRLDRLGSKRQTGYTLVPEAIPAQEVKP